MLCDLGGAIVEQIKSRLVEFSSVHFAFAGQKRLVLPQEFDPREGGRRSARNRQSGTGAVVAVQRPVALSLFGSGRFGRFALASSHRFLFLGLGRKVPRRHGSLQTVPILSEQEAPLSRWKLVLVVRVNLQHVRRRRHLKLVVGVGANALVGLDLLDRHGPVGGLKFGDG